MIDINSGTFDQLKTLVGIGDTYAKRIVQGRPYQRTNELVTKKVIPQMTYDKIKDHILMGAEISNCRQSRRQPIRQRSEPGSKRGSVKEGSMKTRSRTSIMIVTAFFMGFGLGGLSLHYASAQGMLGLSTSVSQLGSALVDMQKNVDDLQKNMGTVKQVKDQLSSLSPRGEGTPGGDLLKKGGDSLKDMKPKF